MPYSNMGNIYKFTEDGPKYYGQQVDPSYLSRGVQAVTNFASDFGSGIKNTASSILGGLNNPISNTPTDWAKRVGISLGGNEGDSLFNRIGIGIFGDKFDITNADQMKVVDSYAKQFQDSQLTWGDIGKFGIGLGIQGFNMYSQYKQNKLAERQAKEMMALNRANYRNSAKAFNNQLRNQQSGRSFNGMSGSAKASLGREYQSRKANEDY